MDLPKNDEFSFSWLKGKIDIPHVRQKKFQTFLVLISEPITLKKILCLTEHHIKVSL